MTSDTPVRREVRVFGAGASVAFEDGLVVERLSASQTSSAGCASAAGWWRPVRWTLRTEQGWPS